MLQLKSCPRCTGDVVVGEDWHGAYRQCLQCGWYKDTSNDPVRNLAQAALADLMEDFAHQRAS